MKYIEAEELPDGSHRFVIETAPASEESPAVTREFTWGKDVPIETAKREMKALFSAPGVPRKKQPKALNDLVGSDL